MSEERDDPRDVVDALIDEAARALTHGEPPASLRRHVHASITSPPPRRPLVWAPAMAAVVIAASAWLVMRDVPVVPRSEGVPPVVTRSEPPDTPAQRVAGAGSVAPLAPARAERRDTPEPVRPAVVVLSAERVTQIDDPLPAIEPIEIEGVPTSAMATIERIPAPAPLSVDAIAIESLFE